MKLSLSLLVSLRTLGLVKSQTSSWSGNLPFNVYGPGDGCSDTNIVGNGTTIGLALMDDGNLCETDVIGGTNLYSKIVQQCGTDEYPDGKLFYCLSTYNIYHAPLQFV